MNVARLMLLALLALLAAAPATAQDQPLVPPDTLAQEQTQPPDEDDEELGEEIPDDEPDEPDEPDSGSGGEGGSPNPPADPPTESAARAQDTLPRTGNDPLPLAVVGGLLLASGLLVRPRSA